MKRWLVLPIGLALATAVGWLLLSEPVEDREAPRGEIGPDSEARLREILREADEQR